jgi:putative hydrolase of the HAD superfamily
LHNTEPFNIHINSPFSNCGICFKQSAYNFYKDHVLKVKSDLNDYELEGILQDCMNWDLFGHYNKSFVKENLEKKYHIILPYDDFNQYFVNHFGKYAVLFDGVVDTLVELKKQGYILVCLTNGDYSVQNSKLETTKIKPYFDKVIISGEVGIRKPDPRIYEYTCNLANIKPEETLFIGDTYSTDIVGAYRANIRPVWVCSDTMKVCAMDTLRIPSFNDLPELLKTL